MTQLLSGLNHKHEPHVIPMKKKTALLAMEEEPLVDLTFHVVPASLLSEFAEKIVKPYYSGNINTAIQDLIKKAIADRLRHVTCYLQ